jgi:CHAT domain
VIDEEYKGDFAAAGIVAGEAFLAARVSGATDEFAEALVGRAIVHVLQCELRDARADLSEVDRLAGRGDVLLRAVPYRTLAAYLDFNCFPNDVVGLARGLLATGARAAVLSLWAVGDISTSLLMTRFCGRLREGDLPAFALAAQEHLRALSPKEAQASSRRCRKRSWAKQPARPWPTISSAT